MSAEIIDFKSRQVIKKAEPDFVRFESFFIQALVDWIIKNDQTPFLHVKENYKDVVIPSGYADESGMVKLKVSPSAVMDFSINEDSISFSASFANEPFQVSFPPLAVAAVSDGGGKIIVAVNTRLYNG